MFNVQCPNHQRTIGAAESERIAEHRVDLSINGLGGKVQLLRVFVRILEINVRSDEVILHHDNAIDNLAGLNLLVLL